ncbi:MAG: hypothetical protein H2058_01895 [Muricauda sp.]|nr:hypothetical protein [Allomuricauda sp.]MBA4743985.1 hypothetical protein [Allomuricauda sp.]
MGCKKEVAFCFRFLLIDGLFLSLETVISVITIWFPSLSSGHLTKPKISDVTNGTGFRVKHGITLERFLVASPAQNEAMGKGAVMFTVLFN